MHSYTAVLTVFNAEMTILTALNSILGQTNLPSEIIIIDDCSTDRTFLIASEFQAKNTELCVLRNEVNLGVAYSRNIAVEMAKNEYVIFFDDDDISLPNRAKTHLEHFETGASVSFVSSTKIYVNGYRVNNFLTEFLGKLHGPDFVRNQVLGGADRFSTPASCMALNKETFLEVKGFDRSLRRLEDTDISIRLALSNVVFGFSPDIRVERFDFGKSPSSHETDSQKAILNKFREFLTNSEYKQAIFKIDIHDLYFKRKYVSLVFRFLREIIRRPFVILYFYTGLKRVKHDWLKR